MFETVAPVKASRGSRSALYEGLSLSIVVHGLAAVAALASNIWEVSFPTTSPPFVVSFVLAATPPPPPPPPPAKPLEVKQETITTARVLPLEALMAPTVIPDEIPVVKPESFTPVAFAVSNGVEGGVADGMDGGVVGGTIGGDTGGKIGGTIGGVVEFTDGRVHIARDKKLPMLPLSQVYPNYPEDARVRSWEDAMVVRYIIGKDGRVKEVIVLSPPERPIFVDGTLRAIRSWRFKPLIRDGEKQEVVHELTVFYKLSESTGG